MLLREGGGGRGFPKGASEQSLLKDLNLPLGKELKQTNSNTGSGVHLNVG